MSAELPDAWLRVMNVLIEAPSAWRAPAEVAAALGRDEDETQDVLCALDLAGLIAVWEEGARFAYALPVPRSRPEGPVVTLSPLAAEWLGVRIIEVGPEGIHRWARAGDPDPAPYRSRYVGRSDRAPALDLLADSCPTPDVSAERGEQAEARARALDGRPVPARRVDDLPRPTQLIGLGVNPFPDLEKKTEPVECPACRGRELGPQMYCLCCNRWGLDGLTVPVAPRPRPTHAPAPAPAGAPAEPDARARERIEAGQLRARRKEKRRRKRQQQVEAEALRRRGAPGRPAGNPHGKSARPPASSPAADFARPPRSAAAAPRGDCLV